MSSAGKEIWTELTVTSSDVLLDSSRSLVGGECSVVCRLPSRIFEEESHESVSEVEANSLLLEDKSLIAFSSDGAELVEVPHGCVIVLNFATVQQPTATYYNVFDCSRVEDINFIRNIQRIGFVVDVTNNLRAGKKYFSVSRELVSTNSPSDEQCTSALFDKLVVETHSAIGTETDIAAFSNAPDRKRAVAGYDELKKLYPNRNLSLILVNVTPTEVIESDSDVERIVDPSRTVLDKSLATVMYFVLRGSGVSYDTQLPTKTIARHFVVGSGADELCGGYSRHRHRFEKDGFPGVAEELEAELQRYGARNAGRDARVAAFFGRTLVAPFLSPSLITYLNELPIDAKCDLSLPRGHGEKKIIRKTLQLKKSEYFKWPKQAMQFGSRLVKLFDKDVKGSDEASVLTLRPEESY